MILKNSKFVIWESSDGMVPLTPENESVFKRRKLPSSVGNCPPKKPKLSASSVRAVKNPICLGITCPSAARSFLTAVDAIRSSVESMPIDVETYPNPNLSDWANNRGKSIARTCVELHVAQLPHDGRIEQSLQPAANSIARNTMTCFGSETTCGSCASVNTNNKKKTQNIFDL